MAKAASEIAGAVLPPKPKAGKGSKYLEFAMPANFQPPAGIGMDEDFKALGTFRLKENGRMCLTAVDGSPVGTDEKEVKNEPTEERTEPY